MLVLYHAATAEDAERMGLLASLSATEPAGRSTTGTTPEAGLPHEAR